MIKFFFYIFLTFPLYACEKQEILFCDINETIDLPENFDGDEVDLGIEDELFKLRNGEV